MTEILAKLDIIDYGLLLIAIVFGGGSILWLNRQHDADLKSISEITAEQWAEMQQRKKQVTMLSYQNGHRLEYEKEVKKTA